MSQLIHPVFPRLARQALLLVALALTALAASPVRAQDAPTFKNEELDQMLAPIALYPDSLLAQILMASTYPADVKEAVAWSKAHPDDKGDAAIKKVEAKAWEPAVQSLVAFPQVLAMMGARPDDVQRLGDAFLADPARVMDRVQVLRKKAQDAGNLKSTEQQKVSTQTEASKQVIIIEPAQPQSVYVPVYQPTVVYGTWGYPAYPPYYWAPPPYYYPGAAFVGGVLWGAAIVGISNGLWGGANWGGGDVNINVNKYNNINSNRKIENTDNKFKHNSERRGDVPYRDSKSREQHGKKQLDGAKDREAYRGKDGREAQRDNASATLKDRGADPAAGRDKLQGADRDKANAAVANTDRSAANRDRSSANNGAAGGTTRDMGAGSRDGADRSGQYNRDAKPASRPTGSGANDNALSGARNSGADRANASRGNASRSSMNSTSRPAGRSGGGGRGR